MQCSGGKEGVSSGDECREEARCAAGGCKVRWDEEEKERKEKIFFRAGELLCAENSSG